MGSEKVPHGFGLTGDRAVIQLMVLGTTGGRPAEHGLLGTEGLPEPRTSISFPETQYPRLGRGGRKDCVRLWVF